MPSLQQDRIPVKPPVVSSGEQSKPHSRWAREILKFVGLTVTTQFQIGEEIHSLTGTLVAWEPNSAFLVLDTQAKSIFIRYPLTVTRGRKHAGAA